jgi:hypothetical protein
MKTCLEHYEELPEPFRAEAIANYKAMKNKRDLSCITLEGAVLTGFDWVKSKEGAAYWYKFYKTLMPKQ